MTFRQWVIGMAIVDLLLFILLVINLFLQG
jgi:hypothetical protein